MNNLNSPSKKQFLNKIKQYVSKNDKNKIKKIIFDNGGIEYNDTSAAEFTPDNHFVFTRSKGFEDKNGVRQHQNITTSFLDGSVVYGSDETTASELREFKDGKLKIQDNGLLPTRKGNKGNSINNKLKSKKNGFPLPILNIHSLYSQ